MVIAKFWSPNLQWIFEWTRSITICTLFEHDYTNSVLYFHTSQVPCIWLFFQWPLSWLQMITLFCYPRLSRTEAQVTTICASSTRFSPWPFLRNWAIDCALQNSTFANKSSSNFNMLNSVYFFLNFIASSKSQMALLWYQTIWYTDRPFFQNYYMSNMNLHKWLFK